MEGFGRQVLPYLLLSVAVGLLLLHTSKTFADVNITGLHGSDCQGKA